jgi:methionyl-tRNA formyltransferase
MLSKRSIRISPDDTAGSLFEALATLGAGLLIETLPAYMEGKLTPQPQPEEGATYAPMLKKEDGRLDFNQPVVELERRIRAMNPWPGAWFEWNDTVLKVGKGSVSEAKGKAVGSRLIVDGRPAVTCADGVLILDEVQPPGKKMMPGKAFLSGARNWESS